MIDCLFVGHNDGCFPEYVDMVRALGTGIGPWRRVNLSYVDIDAVPHRAMDVLNRTNGRDGGTRPLLSSLEGFSPTIACLASYIARRGFSFEYVTQFQPEKASLAAMLEQEDVLAVAITTTFYLGTAWIDEIVSFVREHNPSAAIVVGGPYIHNQSLLTSPDELLELFEHIGADVYVVSGEGEVALTQVLDALKHGKSLSRIDNIAFRHRGRYVRTSASVESTSLADEPVDYGLFPRKAVGEFVSMRTAKSCPFACAFCSYPRLAGKYVSEGVETVERDLDRIRDVGTVTTLTFIDDTLNVPLRRFKDILRMMIRNGYGFRWNGFLRADHVDDECIGLMQRSGCEGVFLGVESGSDAMLERMNKSSRSIHYRRVIPRLRDAGILTHCSLIIGFPGETRDTVRETVDLLEDARPDTYRAQVWYCDPSTPIWSRRDAVGLVGRQSDWRHATMDAGTAADIVDELFLTARASVWLPQGFESWNLFYLQRKGMPLDRILHFVRSFNDAVRFKISHPGTPVDAALLQALDRTARFTAPTRPARRRPLTADTATRA